MAHRTTMPGVTGMSLHNYSRVDTLTLVLPYVHTVVIFCSQHHLNSAVSGGSVSLSMGGETHRGQDITRSCKSCLAHSLTNLPWCGPSWKTRTFTTRVNALMYPLFPTMGHWERCTQNTGQPFAQYDKPASCKPSGSHVAHSF